MTVSSEKPRLEGLRVVSFESRRSQQMADSIAERGGEALVAPSMRPVPLSENREAYAFAEKLAAGQVDFLVCMTGVGTQTLLQIIESVPNASVFRRALEAVRVIARGPKPLEVLRQANLRDPIQVPEPETWREVLQVLDGFGPLKGKTVAIQESGGTNREFIEALAARGARVLRVPIYRWALPENTAPLREAIRAVIDGKADVVLFTNANQIDHVLRLAQEDGLESALREALGHVVVASVGPVCSEFLDEYGLPVDLEPEHPKMDSLLDETSRKGPAILEEKRRSVVIPAVAPLTSSPAATGRGSNVRMGPPPRTAGDDGGTSSTDEVLRNSLFMKACRCETTSRTPIWLMRQAGRYMKEYRDIRARHSFLDLCKDADLACEVSVYAAQRLGVDAAIIFSDILVILEPLGLSLEYAKGEGPVIHNPVRTIADVQALRSMKEPEPLGFVYEAIRKTRAALPNDIPLIGFAGAPFTLASYMIEGQGSRNFIHTKALMYRHPDAWAQLMNTLADSLVVYLNAQVAAGAQVVQLFDSWVGCLSPSDYKQYVLPFSQRVIRGIQRGVPVIHFGTQTGTLLELMRDAGGDVIGIDWRVELDQVWKRLGPVAIQGNLDPVVLFSEPHEIKRQAKRILDQAAGRPGHIFNLGHGVLPTTPVGHVKALVDAVHELSAR